MSIKEARKNRNLTQKQLAKLVGVDYSVISKYENGSITPPADRLKAIANVLDVSVDYLIEDKILEEPINFSVDVDQMRAYAYELRKTLILYSRGACELCGCSTQLSDENSASTLDLHYVKWLAHGGLPIRSNAVVLCKSCHNRIHSVNSIADNEKLLKVIEQRENTNSSVLKDICF